MLNSTQYENQRTHTRTGTDVFKDVRTARQPENLDFWTFNFILPLIPEPSITYANKFKNIFCDLDLPLNPWPSNPDQVVARL